MKLNQLTLLIFVGIISFDQVQSIKHKHKHHLSLYEDGDKGVEAGDA